MLVRRLRRRVRKWRQRRRLKKLAQEREQLRKEKKAQAAAANKRGKWLHKDKKPKTKKKKKKHIGRAIVIVLIVLQARRLWRRVRKWASRHWRQNKKATQPPRPWEFAYYWTEEMSERVNDWRVGWRLFRRLVR